MCAILVKAKYKQFTYTCVKQKYICNSCFLRIYITLIYSCNCICVRNITAVVNNLRRRVKIKNNVIPRIEIKY